MIIVVLIIVIIVLFFVSITMESGLNDQIYMYIYISRILGPNSSIVRYLDSGLANHQQPPTTLFRYPQTIK